MAAQVLSQVGKYELVRLIRRGGMGTVYEARNTDTDGRCALKLLRPELAESPDFKRRFSREARVGGLVESDHIVRVFDSGADASGCPFLVMEYLEGEDLEATKARLGALDARAALKIALQAAIGLAKAHEAGIVHRDLKPANLFLTTNDAGEIVLKILDFGLAKMKMERLHDAAAAATRSDELLGTPLYMSPEQCRGAGKIDARSDVWSLGVVLWELLSGGSPFVERRALGALMASIMTEELPALQDAAPWIAADIAAVVEQAMTRDLDRRLQSAGELRDALLRVTPGGSRLLAAELIALSPESRALVARRARRGRDQSRSGVRRKFTFERLSAPAVIGIVVISSVLGGLAAAQLTPKRTERRESAPLGTRVAAAAAPAALSPGQHSERPNEPASVVPAAAVEPAARRTVVPAFKPSASRSNVAPQANVAPPPPVLLPVPTAPKGLRTDTRDFPDAPE